ncbi:MAG: DNA-protecting protein DprA [Gammaproteobacteria bacterium]|nr:DNA-protecting protein DprA [Gammaproteobacteria bacterium]
MGQGPDQTELRFRVALHAISGIGPRRFLSLLERFGSAREVIRAAAGPRATWLPEEVQQALRNPDWNAADRACAFAAQPGCAIVPHDASAYPPLLATISDPPPLLFVRGDLAKLSATQMAIVGSRTATLAGRHHARRFAAELAHVGLVVTSGLAYGVDAEAHRGALERGATIAVLGSGIDRIYPDKHMELAGSIIAKGGALVSELPLAAAPTAPNFPRRNRIISGLSAGVLVIEARTRSGSLLTARHALEQGREVFALPGSIDNPCAQGCNELIQQGAKLVCRTQDILDELVPYIGQRTWQAMPDVAVSQNPGEPLSQPVIKVLSYLNDEPVSLDMLVDRSGLTVSEVSSMLSLLELAGQVEVRPGGLYLRCPG